MEKGKKTLAGDAAHKAAIGAFAGKPRGLLWMDTGWIGQVALEYVKDNEELKEELDKTEEDYGIKHKALVLKGDKRITSYHICVKETESSGTCWP